MPERTFRNRELMLMAHRVAFASGQDVDAMLQRITLEQLYDRITAYLIITRDNNVNQVQGI